MGGGNGAKAANKRERNAKAAGPQAKSILKDKEKMMSHQCQICRVSVCGVSRVYMCGCMCVEISLAIM
jgi:hypothetical protein